MTAGGDNAGALYQVTSFPTIVRASNDKFLIYRSARSLESLKTFAMDPDLSSAQSLPTGFEALIAQANGFTAMHLKRLEVPQILPLLIDMSHFILI